MFENIRLSLKGILSHKIRSLLTMLGIIIGIAAIIAIVSTIEGTREEIKNNLIGSGSNNVRIQLMRGDNPYDFTYSGAPENVREIQPESKERIKSLKEVAGCTLYRTRNYLEQLYYKDTKLQSAVVNGIDEDYFDTVGMAVAEGVGFPEQAKTGSMKIAWIDAVDFSAARSRSAKCWRSAASSSALSVSSRSAPPLSRRSIPLTIT